MARIAVALLGVLAVIGLVFGSVASASGTTGQQQKQAAQQYKPGSSRCFNWYDLDKGLEKMKEKGQPGMVYYYTPADPFAARVYEEELLKHEAFKETDRSFVCVMVDSTKRTPTCDRMRIPRNGTGVLLFASDGRLLTPVTRPPSIKFFQKLLSDALAANARPVTTPETKKRR